MSSDSVPYRSEIDGLRAVAVVAVVAFHAFPEALSGGFAGVDVFFVISGFLITSIVAAQLTAKNFSIPAFYARRVLRLFPALLIVVAGCFAIGWYFLLAGEFDALGQHMLAGSLYVANFWSWSQSGYFDLDSYTKPLLHLWSLGIEEQFYLAWPLCIWLAWGCGVEKWQLATLVALLSWALCAWYVVRDPAGAFYLPFFRIWELLAGAVVAFVQPKFGESNQSLSGPRVGRLPSWLPDIRGMVGLATLLICFTLISPQDDFPWLFAPVVVLATCLLLTAHASDPAVRWILQRKPVVYLGLISYPLYLWHWPLLSFVHIASNGTPVVASRLAVVGVSVVLAMLTYHGVEKRLRQMRLRHRRVVPVLAIGSLVVATLGGVTHWQEGFPNRFEPTLQALNDIVSHPHLALASARPCKNTLTEFEDTRFRGLCFLTQATAPKLVFFGDSHTLHYQDAIWASFGSHPTMLLAQPSCFPFVTEKLQSEVKCKESLELASRYLITSDSIDTVVLSGYWGYLMAGSFGRKGPSWRNPITVTAPAADSFIANAKRLIVELHQHGKRVVLMRDIPSLDFDIPTCFALRPHSTPSRSDCSMDLEKYEKDQFPYDAVLDRLIAELPFVEVYNPRPRLCPNSRCLAANGRFPYYSNGDHVNRIGAEYVFADLTSKINLKQKPTADGQRALDARPTFPPTD